MKARTCFATEVVESDRFLSLSLQSQLCYFHICCEARPSGLIVGASRVVRGYGFGQDELDELLQGGYLLEVDGTLYVRHTWVNNQYDARLFDKAMSSCEPYKSGRLVFVGEIGKSEYCLNPNDESTTFVRQPDVDEVKGSDSDLICSEMSCTEENVNGSEGMQGRGNKHPCMCQRCGSSKATYTSKDGTTLIECPNCGKYSYQR